MPTDSVRLTAVFSGDVQGVGFRYTAIHLAQGFNVSGYVRNTSDDRVELVAEGERAELERFLGAVQRKMLGYVRQTDAQWAQATGEFRGFTIRF